MGSGNHPRKPVFIFGELTRINPHGASAATGGARRCRVSVGTGSRLGAITHGSKPSRTIIITGRCVLIRVVEKVGNLFARGMIL